MSKLNSVVTHVMQVSPIMKIIRVAPIGWELPDFIPGQFCALGLPGTSPRCIEAAEEAPLEDPLKIIKRAYSIASSSKTKEYVEFYITLIKSGALTPRLFNLSIGDSVEMGTKFVGMFTLDQVPLHKNIILIGTGTGVAPYMSMLRTDALTSGRKIVVIHGAANSWDLGYSSELNLLQSIASSTFTYIPTITEPQNEKTKWNGETRFIEEILEDDTLAKSLGGNPTAENTAVFLCGNPKMVNTVTQLFEARGFKENTKKETGQIYSEKF